MTAFDRLHPAVQYHVVNSLGWPSLRSVQEESIGPILDGANLIVLAPTAGGKTEAAFLPLLSHTLSEKWTGLSVLYVSPIKALLNNQQERLERYYSLVGRRAALWHGDVGAGEKNRLRDEQPDCLLTTPESLEAILISARSRPDEFFRHVRAVVIDEVHAFAGSDRGWHLLALFQRIGRLATHDLQRIGLSATVGNPHEMLKWLSAGSSRPQQLIDPPITNRVADVQIDHVGSLANAARVIEALHRGEKRLVFCDSRARVEELGGLLHAAGVRAFITHSSLSVDERRQAETAFASGRDCVIVATSALELGIDVGDLDRVIQIDAPSTVSSFLQRMGRTGRRSGAVRNCLFLATRDEALLRSAALVKLWESGFVEPVEPPSRPFHLLAQQLLAVILQQRGVPSDEWFGWVDGVPGFAECSANDRDSIIQWMLSEQLIWNDSGLLSMGRTSEDEFGRRNFLELCSVFLAPPEVRVMHGRLELGSVHATTFMIREDGPVVLSLAGRSWRVQRVDWRRREAFVEPYDLGGRSRWRGEGQSLSAIVCRAIRSVVTSGDSSSRWSKRATTAMETIRQDYDDIADGRTSLVRSGNGTVRWWTFAGRRANAALASALGRELQRGVSSDNFSLRLPAESTSEELLRAIDAIRSHPDRVFVEVDQDAMDGLKFGSCLPPFLASDVVQTRLSDPEAVSVTLAESMQSVVNVG